MNKENRNHYFKLLGVFVLMFGLGTIYNEINKNSESSTEKKKENKEKNENVSGGACTYKYDSLPVVILEIIPSSNEASDLVLHQCMNSGNDRLICDTIFYSNTMNRSIENIELEKMQLKKGDSITLLIGNITSGHCNPVHSYIRLSKFKN